MGNFFSMISKPLRDGLTPTETVRRIITFIFFCLPLIAPAALADPIYPWRNSEAVPKDDLRSRFAPPHGFKRVAADERSFAKWLRNLPLKPLGTAVHLFDGRLKFNQSAHAAVIDIDVGKRDLQQCADAVMRLRAEYLYGLSRFDDIHFNFTDGTKVAFSRWQRGDRPKMSGRKTRWRRGGKTGYDRKNFNRYMTMIFSYAGTYSLDRELKPVHARELQAGDVFIKGGFPGHAIIVADVVISPTSGQKQFLLIQSYMPAQDMHVLNNPNSADGSPWYELAVGDELVTPEWTFSWSDLKRFGD